MTVSTLTSTVTYPGNGATTQWPFAFPVQSPTYLVVTITDPFGFPTVLSPSQYATSGIGAVQGGKVFYPISGAPIPADGTTITIDRVLPIVQNTKLRGQDGYYPEVVEGAFDYLTELIQQQGTDIARVRTMIANLVAGVIIPDPTGGAAVARLISDLASATPGKGAALVSFLAAQTGAVLRSVQDKLGDLPVSVEDFGGKGDGTFDNATVFARAAAAGVSLALTPGAIYITSQTFGPMASGTRITGNGATIQARAGALLGELYWPTAANPIVDGLIFDGNRANGGMATDASYVVYLPVSGAKLLNCEVRNGTRYGVALGANVAVDDITLIGTRIHDNGGVTDDTGIGVGIGRIGSVFPTNVKIIGCTIERNHNTVVQPNDSTGINGLANGAIITGNFLRDNYNVNGGQLAVSGGNPADDTTIVSNNIIKLTGTFGGDVTTAIEIDCNNASCFGNIVQGATGDAIRLEGSSTGISVQGNVVSCAQVGVNLINSGGTGPGKVDITSNKILAAAVGISSQTSATGQIFADDNYIDASVATPFAGVSNFTRIRNNDGYAPVQTSGAAGASPYTWPFVPYDALYVLSTAGGISSHALDGVGMSVAAGVPILVKAGHTFTTTWTTTAPTYAIAPCQ